MRNEGQISEGEFRAEWDRLEFARQVAAELIRYRAERRLTQRSLAGRLGVSRTRVMELESGEFIARPAALQEISRTIGLDFASNG